MTMLFRKAKAESSKRDFKDIPPQEIDGFVFFIKDIQNNKRFICGKDCAEVDENDVCSYCIMPKVRGSFSCVEVLIQIIGTTSVNGTWMLDNDNVKIVSTSGYTYSGKILCSEVEDMRHLAHECDDVLSRTKADVVYTFPLLPKGEDIQAVIISKRYGPSIRFDIFEQDTEDEYSLDYYKIRQQSSEEQQNDLQSMHYYGLNESYSLTKATNRVNNIKVLIHQRLHSRLTPMEAQKIEDSIETSLYSLTLDYSDEFWYDNKTTQTLYDELKELVADYREAVLQKKLVEKNHDYQLKRVSELFDMNPFDFEILCATLLEKQGYTNVRVTPRANDKGIDIIGEYESKTIVVQCKRYKSSVGSPDMQKFVGAMHNANANGGVFITTGTFTKEAEAMAKTNNISLIDRERLAKQLSLVNDYQTTIIQPTLWDESEDDLPI